MNYPVLLAYSVLIWLWFCFLCFSCPPSRFHGSCRVSSMGVMGMCFLLRAVLNWGLNFNEWLYIFHTYSCALLEPRGLSWTQSSKLNSDITSSWPHAFSRSSQFRDMVKLRIWCEKTGNVSMREKTNTLQSFRSNCADEKVRSANESLKQQKILVEVRMRSAAFYCSFIHEKFSWRSVYTSVLWG